MEGRTELHSMLRNWQPRGIPPNGDVHNPWVRNLVMFEAFFLFSPDN